MRAQLSSTLLAVVAQRLLPTKDGEGRVVAVEVLVNNAAVANLIRENKVQQIGSIMETQGKAGMVSMDTAIKKLFLEGRIAEEAARRHMRFPQSLFG